MANMGAESQAPWQVTAAAKRESTYAKIPHSYRLSEVQRARIALQRDITGEWIEQHMQPEEASLTNMTATKITSLIRSKDHSARAVVEAFCNRAALAHQMSNCLHEIFFEQALDRARQLDLHQDEVNDVVGPLHGLPVSLKDQFHVRGNDTSMGYIGWLDTFEGSKDPEKVHKVDSQIVTDLLSLGAVLYCKTSVPQTLIRGETENNLIGTTLNPHNCNVSCGGSSGGEGALAALGASPVGLGTDIGGSVRIPAAFCGITAIKPTHDRLSYRDMANTMPGETTYSSSVGIMSPHLESLRLVLTSLLSTCPWERDPYTAHMPWRKEIEENTLLRVREDGYAVSHKGLKLGFLWSDRVVTPHPPIQRGLRMMYEAVLKFGHKAVDWNPPSHDTLQQVHWTFLKADGGYDINQQLNLSGEPLIPPLRDVFKLQDSVSTVEYQKRIVQGRDLERAYLDYWNSTSLDDGQQVDAVIMPVAPHAAVTRGKYYHVGYTEAINLLDYTSVVIPVTKADKKIDVKPYNFSALNEKDKKNWDAYDAEWYNGAPVGLQIVGRKYSEEKTLAIAKILQDALQNMKTGG